MVRTASGLPHWANGAVKSTQYKTTNRKDRTMPPYPEGPPHQAPHPCRKKRAAFAGSGALWGL